MLNRVDNFWSQLLKYKGTKHICVLLPLEMETRKCNKCKHCSHYKKRMHEAWFLQISNMPIFPNSSLQIMMPAYAIFFHLKTRFMCLKVLQPDPYRLLRSKYTVTFKLIQSQVKLLTKWLVYEQIPQVQTQNFDHHKSLKNIEKKTLRGRSVNSF